MAELSLQAYIVGGAVRDRLLGLPGQDRDWVVVGATPDEMLAQGFKPVGKDFPVFLHPLTHEEYALARTERKTAPGYRGFVFHTSSEVSLEDDLIRRDLTINAIAQAADGRLIDPFGGQQDLAAKVFRHVSPAFAEDPVRILRLARFAARFTDFEIAPETLVLMQQMVAAGEVDHLVPERVWQELSRGLMSIKPSRMLRVLRACGALARLLPEVDALYGVPQPPQHHPEVDTGLHIEHAIDIAARDAQPLTVRWAALVHDLGKATSPPAEWPHHYAHEARSGPLAQTLSERLRAPQECRDLAVIVALEHGNVHKVLEAKATTLVRLLERLDAWRRAERFEQILQACVCDAQGRPGFETRDYPQAIRLRLAREACLRVNASAVAAACRDKALIPEAIYVARVDAVKALLLAD